MAFDPSKLKPVGQDTATGDVRDKLRPVGSTGQGQSSDLEQFKLTPSQTSVVTKPKSLFARYLDYSKGFAKGVASTAAGASELGEKMLSLGQKEEGKMLGHQVLASGKLEPEGTMEKVGFGVERVGEAVGASLLFGTPTAAPGASALTKVGVSAAKAGLAGAEMGSLEAMHQGEINKDVGKTALTAAAASLAFDAATAVTKKVAKTAWDVILKPTPSQALEAPKLGEKASETGIVGATRNQILKKIGKNIQSLEVQIGERLSTTEGTVDGTDIVPYLDALKAQYAAVPGYAEYADDVAALQQEYLAKGTMTAPEANELKRSIYQLIERAYGKGDLQISVDKAAQKAAARGLKTELEKIAPELKDLNAKQGVLLEMKDILERTTARMEGKGLWGTGIGLYDLGLGAIGGLLGVAGNPAAGVVVGTSKIVAEQPLVLSGVAKLANYFNALSPTQKLIFGNAITGMIAEIKGRKAK